MNFQEWFAAHRRRHPNAVINERTRDLYRAWLRNNPRDPGEGGPGAGRVPGLPASGVTPSNPAPEQQPAPAQPAGPPPTVAARVDAAQELGINNLVNARNLLPREFNSQRNRAATNFRSGMLDSGYFDDIGMTSEQGPSTAKYMQFQDVDADGQPGGQQVRKLTEVAKPSDAPDYEGNITYKFQYGPDGRLYRQAYMNAANSFASRGVFSSSLLGDTNRRNLQSMDASRDQSMRNYNDAVGQINSNQTTEDTRLTNQIGESSVGYSNWTGQQDVTIPSTTNTPSTTDNSGKQNVVTPPATSTPPAGNLGTWTVRAAGANAIPRLTRQVRTRNPGVSFRIVRRGDRYVAVRT